MTAVERATACIEDLQWQLVSTIEDAVREESKRVHWFNCLDCGVNWPHPAGSTLKHCPTCLFNHAKIEPVLEMRERCVQVVRDHLVFNSQREVSWHEIQDCIEAVRKLDAEAKT